MTYIISSLIRGFRYYAKIKQSYWDYSYVKPEWEGLKQNATQYESKAEAEIVAQKLRTNLSLEIITFDS